VSVSGNYQGGLETTTPVALTDGSQTTIYTAPNRFMVLASFALVNTTGSAITATCYHYDGSTNNVIYKAAVAAHSTTIVSEIPRRLKDGDIFKVTAAADLVVVPTVITGHINEAAYAPSGAGFSARG
jgi:hypothetical protein